MSDIRDKIKSRVKKLLDLAADDGAFDGEIAAAMLAAERLMDAYHLEEAECRAATAQETGQAAPAPTMAEGQAWTFGRALTTWETTLAWAISDLVGCVQWYRLGATVTESTGGFKQPTVKTPVMFYGPDEDVRIAGDLFGDWTRVIGTLAVGKFGDCTRGNGGRYALGFAAALRQKARDAQHRRAEIVTSATTALMRVGGDHSLAAVNEQTRTLARQWLEQTKGWKLRSGSGRNGYRSGSYDAYAAGRADGSRADFSAKRTPKLTG